MMSRSSRWGVVLLFFGIAYLLIQLKVIPWNSEWLRGDVIWPGLLALFGLYDLVEKRRARAALWPIFLFVLGLLLLLRDLHLVAALTSIPNGWDLFWALLLIFAGLDLVLPKRGRLFTIRILDINSRRRDGKESIGTWPLSGKGSRQKQASRDFGARRLIGELMVGRSPWTLRSADYWTGVGETRINLATAYIEDGDYELDVSGWIGEIRILVPESLDVSADVHLGVGEINVFGDSHSGPGGYILYEDPTFGQSRRRCKLKVNLSIGSISLVRV